MSEQTRPALILHTSGVVNIDREFPVGSLDALQATVGGDVELVPIHHWLLLEAMCAHFRVDLGERPRMLVDAEARLKKPQPALNAIATELAGQPVRGDVLLIDLPTGSE